MSILPNVVIVVLAASIVVAAAFLVIVAILVVVVEIVVIVVIVLLLLFKMMLSAFDCNTDSPGEGKEVDEEVTDKEEDDLSSLHSASNTTLSV